MAAAPASTIVMAAFVGDDETILDVAAVRCSDKSLAFEGSGFLGVVELANVALKNKWNLVSFNGLNIFERSYQELFNKDPKSQHLITLKSIAAAHNDMAYDFLVDNGYQLLWEMIALDLSPPENAPQAALALAGIVKKVLQTGQIQRKTVAGNVSHWPLTTFFNGNPQLRPVKSARTVLDTHPPDQSRMTHDIPNLRKFTRWLE